MTFEHFAIGVGITLLLLMIPAMLRIVNGPTALDRIVAVNVIGTKTAVLLVVIGVVFKQVGMFVDFALAYALLNFTGSIAAARYLHRAGQRGGDAPSGEEAD
jgi:multicomponent Na+:H+ antiporter subunit F